MYNPEQVKHKMTPEEYEEYCKKYEIWRGKLRDAAKARKKESGKFKKETKLNFTIKK